MLISLTPNHRAVRLQLKKCELHQIGCQGVRMQMHTSCHEGLSIPLPLSLSLSATLSSSISVCVRLYQTSSETHCSAGNALTIQTAGLYTLDLTL